MTANQISRGVHWRSAASRIGFIGACLALASACGGSIEETDVDRVHLENGSTGVPQTATPTSTTSSSATPTPAAPAPAAATPAAATPAAPAPAAAPPPAAATTPPAADPTPAADPPAAAAEDVSFASDVYPIFTSNCGPCHTAGNSGGQSIGAADKATALSDAKKFKDAIVSDVSSGAMPLGCAKPPGGGGSCLTTDEFDTIKAWIAAGTPP